MRTLRSALVVVAALVLAAGIQRGLAIAATLLEADKAAQIIAVRNVTVKEGAISGELVNNSRRALRDVQLQIRYTWHWKNEFQPRDDSPGDAVLYTVEKEIPPGGTLPFTYRPSAPLPSRPDGYFETTVSVAGFTEIIR